MNRNLSVLLIAALGTTLAVSTARAGTCVAGDCHSSVVSAKYLHGPVAAEEAGVEGCITCHVPSGASCTATQGGEYAFKTKEDRLCLLCHERGTGSQHTRAKSKCLSCHHPHGSESSFTLMRSGG